MSLLLNLKQDDEMFAARLQEVNKEMDTLLHKTSRTRHEMDRTAAEVRMGVPLHFYPHEAASLRGGGRGCAVHAATSLPRATATAEEGALSSATRDDLTRAVVSAELSQWVHTHLPRLVAPLVETQVQQHLQQLRASVEEVQARQSEVEASAKEASSQLRAHRRDIQAGLSALQRGVQQDMDEHQRRIEGQLGAWKEEVQRMKEEVKALQTQSRSETERVDRRLSDALQHQQQQVQENFATLDRDLQRWRLSVQRDIAKDANVLHMQHHEFEGHVAELQGALSSTASMATRCTTEIERLMEDSVMRASEVRLCQRDVNRLEMLVQCAALHTTPARLPAAATSRSKRGAQHQSEKEGVASIADEKDAPALSSVVALAHEIEHVNDKVQAVVSRIDGLDRQVRQLDVALARGAAVMPRSSFFDTVGEESVYHHSGASTRRPSTSQASSVYTARSGAANRACPSFMYSGYPHMDRHGGGDSGSSGSRNASSDMYGRPEHSAAASPKQRLFTQENGVVSPPSILAGGTSSSPHRVESVPMRAGPKASAVHHPLTSHVSSSGLSFEDDAEDPQPMPIVVRDGSAAPGTTSSGLAASRGDGGTKRALSQRRAPPRVIPVESEPTPASGGGGKRASVDTPPILPHLSTQRTAEGSSGASREDSVTDSDKSSNKSSDTKGQPLTGTLNDSPSAFSLDRDVKRPTASNSSSSSSYENAHAPAATTAEAPSPADSYVSDTPALAPSPQDSYVSDGPGIDNAAQSSQDQFGRYTPAPASDSEDERDNQVISRSALD